MNIAEIQKYLDYHIIPANAAEIIEAMLQAKNLGNKTWDRITEQYGCSDGFFFAVKRTISERRAASCTTSNHQAAREDRILRIRNSDGKATARR